MSDREQQQVVFAKLDTGQGGEGEEVLGYLEVEPSSENTFFLQSQQIEIDGEHVILAHEDENGDFFVVVEAEQDNPILMQGLVGEASASQEGSASTSGKKKQAGNQRLLQLASVAQNQLGEKKPNPPSTQVKVEEKTSQAVPTRETRRTKLADSQGTSSSKIQAASSSKASSSGSILASGWISENKPSASEFDYDNLFEESSSKKSEAKKGTLDLTQQVNDVIKVIDSSLDEAEALIAQDKMENAKASEDKVTSSEKPTEEAGGSSKPIGTLSKRVKRKIPSTTEPEAPAKKIKPTLRSHSEDKSAASQENLLLVPPTTSSKSESSNAPNHNDINVLDAKKASASKSDEASKCNTNEDTNEGLADENEAKSNTKTEVQSLSSSNLIAKSRPKRLRKITKDQTVPGSTEEPSVKACSEKDESLSTGTSNSVAPTLETIKIEELSTANHTKDDTTSAGNPELKKSVASPAKKKRKQEISKENPSSPKKKKVVDIFDLLKKQKPPSYTPGLHNKYPGTPIPSSSLSPSAAAVMKKVKLKKPKFTSLNPKPVQNGVKELPSTPPRRRAAPQVRIQPSPPVASTTYSCFKCPYTTSRLNNIVYHHKFLQCSTATADSHDFNWEVDQLPSSRPDPPPAAPSRPSTTAGAPAPPKKTLDSSGMKVTNPLESSDSEDGGSSGDGSQPKMKTGDVVWVEWRDLHRPAVIQEVLSKERKALVTYIEHNTCAKPSVKVSTKRIAAFDNAERNKKFLSESKATSFGESVFKAVARAEDYLRKKCLGYELTANHFFFGEGAAVGVPLEPEVVGSPIPGEPSPSDVSDLEPETEEDANDPIKRKERKRKQIFKLMTIVKGRHVKAHLLGVYSTAIFSERHRKFHSVSSSEKNELKLVSWFGPIDDEDQQEEMYEYCLGLFKNTCKYGKSYDFVAYMFEVWVPEAIVKAISRLYKVSLEEAETMFVAGKPT